MIDVAGKSLIIRHLEHLEAGVDIRVVVGYQAEKVIDTVIKYRDDMIFVFNRKYRETGTEASVSLASGYANEYILSLDGELIVHPDDMKRIFGCRHESVDGGVVETEDPSMLQTYEENGKEEVSIFTNVGEIMKGIVLCR